MTKTIGISPKVIAAVIGAVASYLLTQTILDLPPGVVLLCQVITVGVAAFAARPGLTIVRGASGSAE